MRALLRRGDEQADPRVLGVWGPSGTRVVAAENTWKQPLKWNKEAANEQTRRRVFCASLCDIFEDNPTVDGIRPRLWSLIRLTPNLYWLLLTKRPQRIVDNLPKDWHDGWSNVWIGTSIENNDYVDRANHLRQVPAVVRFVSYEPALGPLDQLDLTDLHWVIYGGESGGKYRKEDKQWARDMRDRCKSAGVGSSISRATAGTRKPASNLTARLSTSTPSRPLS